MMFNKLQKFAAVTATAASIAMTALPTQAGVFFETQFLEQWFTVGQRANTGVDTEDDLFGFALTQSDAKVYDVTLDGVLITFDTGIFLDFTYAGPVTPDDDADAAVTGLVSNGSFLGVIFSDFGVGDFYGLGGIDLDDTNAVVRGTNGSGSNYDFDGSTVEVFYTDAGTERFAQFTFGACVPASPDDCSAAGGQLVVPAPASLALIGLGLLGMAGMRRRRK